jgi:rhodanese-related sulfurtransferase
MRRIIGLLCICIVFSGFTFADDDKKITPEEAFKMIQKPSTYLIDVRSIAEYVFVGHPEMAYSIPLLFWSEQDQRMVPNSNFIEDIRKRFKETDVLVFICRSGKRSLKAAQMAQKAGFSDFYNVGEGIEGEKDEQGYRTRGGWKNELPYTYELNAKLMYHQ